jgi:3-oxoacyl-[acyl-carrier protein] reductase
MGRAVALQLALEGAFVVIQHAEGDYRAVEVVNELQALGTIALGAEGDVCCPEGVSKVFGIVEMAYGRLDLLVNVFDEWRPGSIMETSDEAWQAAIGSGLGGAFLCCRAAERLMKQRPSAAIVNMFYSGHESAGESSVSGVVNAAGITALTKVLAVQLKPKIRVNAVEVCGGNGEPPPNDDIARASVYLLSGEAKAVSGQTVKVGESKNG